MNLYASAAPAARCVKPHKSDAALNSASADFDPTAHPILARHWFGLRPADAGYLRKRASTNRAAGPGEIARARELRRRGLHLRVIEAWRP